VTKAHRGRAHARGAARSLPPGSLPPDGDEGEERLPAGCAMSSLVQSTHSRSLPHLRAAATPALS
jgi:hypothetical protein